MSGVSDSADGSASDPVSTAPVAEVKVVPQTSPNDAAGETSASEPSGSTEPPAGSSESAGEEKEEQRSVGSVPSASSSASSSGNPSAEKSTSNVPEPAAAVGPQLTKLSRREQLREALMAFYKQYKPEKMSVVDTIVDKYIDDQETLFEQLESIYHDVPKVYGHRRLFVGQLAPEVSDSELTQYFERFGRVANASVVKRSGRSRRFGYVQFETAEATVKCLRQIDHQIQGRTITVQEAKATPDVPVTPAPDETPSRQVVADTRDPRLHSNMSHHKVTNSAPPIRPPPRGRIDGRNASQARKFFLGGITKTTNVNHIREHFRQFGQIADAVAVSHRNFGFVTMADDEGFRAVESAPRNIHVLDGRLVDLRRADSRPHVGGGSGPGPGPSASGPVVRQEGRDRDVPRSRDRSPPRLSSGRPGDWTCPNCRNINFERRTHCNRCGVPRQNDHDGSRRGQWSRSRSRSRERRRSPARDSVRDSGHYDPSLPVDTFANSFGRDRGAQPGYDPRHRAGPGGRNDFASRPYRDSGHRAPPRFDELSGGRTRSRSRSRDRSPPRSHHAPRAPAPPGYDDRRPDPRAPPSDYRPSRDRYARSPPRDAPSFRGRSPPRADRYPDPAHRPYSPPPPVNDVRARDPRDYSRRSGPPDIAFDRASASRAQPFPRHRYDAPVHSDGRPAPVSTYAPRGRGPAVSEGSSRHFVPPPASYDHSRAPYSPAGPPPPHARYGQPAYDPRNAAAARPPSPPSHFGGPPPMPHGGRPPMRFGGPPPMQTGGPPPMQRGGPPPPPPVHRGGPPPGHGGHPPPRNWNFR
mmetsp:Transcript_25723/g.37974  ORF Transcript_25723/g.37974 Transcript_25723/m.37974 type:complete len:807 (+) Transcript_25723:277-2697(+)